MNEQIKRAEEVWKRIEDALEKRKDISDEDFVEAACCIQIQQMPKAIKRKIELRMVLANCKNELGTLPALSDDLYLFDTTGIEDTIKKIDQEVGRYYITKIMEGEG